MTNAKTIAVKVVRKSREAEGVMSYDLAPIEGELPAYAAGAHIDVHLPGDAIRQYSLYGAPSARHPYSVAVLLDENGRGGSRSMHEAVNAGDVLLISEPRNSFPLAPSAVRSILIAGGIGITPILAMAEELAARSAEFELHYLARSRSKAAFVDELARKPFAARNSFHFDDEASAPADLVRMIGSPGVEKHLYVCGPSGLIDAVHRTAKEAGWTDDTLHSERFAAASSDRDESGNEFQVVINSTGKVYSVPAEKTIAQVLRENGHRIPTSCEQGICGTCLTGVLDGQVDHRDDFLAPEERASNSEMTICCSRALSSKLVLDL